MTPLVFLVALASISLNAATQIALRKTMLTAGPLMAQARGLVDVISIFLFNPWFVAGLMSFVVSLGLWLFVLGKVEVSLAYPFLSIGYVIVAVIGYAFLGESVGPLRIAGIAIICVGIIVLSQG